MFFLRFLVYYGREETHEPVLKRRAVPLCSLTLHSHTHAHTQVHLPGYYCWTVSRKTADLESAGLTVELKIDVKEQQREMEGWRGILKS